MRSFESKIAQYANGIIYGKDVEIDPSLLLSQDHQGNTILHYLAVKNSPDIFESTINHIIKIHGSQAIYDLFATHNHKGMTIAHIVFGCDTFELVKYVMQYTNNIFVENANGEMPVEIAAMKNRLEVIKLLYHHSSPQHSGVEILRRKYKGKNLLQIAIENNALDLVSFLLSKKDLDYVFHKDFARNNILHIAAESGKIDYIRQILQSYPELELDQTNGCGLTAAEIAANKNHIDIVVELVYHGAIINTELAYSVGYKTVENLTQLIVSSVMDDQGTFIGISMTDPKLHNMRRKILSQITDMRMLTTEKVNTTHNMIEQLLKNLSKASLKVTRNSDEIKKILSPILNEFIKEISYV